MCLGRCSGLLWSARKRKSLSCVISEECLSSVFLIWQKFLLSFGHVAPVITLVTWGITLDLPLKLHLNFGVKVLFAHTYMKASPTCYPWDQSCPIMVLIIYSWLVVLWAGQYMMIRHSKLWLQSWRKNTPVKAAVIMKWHLYVQCSKLCQGLKTGCNKSI